MNSRDIVLIYIYTYKRHCLLKYLRLKVMLSNTEKLKILCPLARKNLLNSLVAVLEIHLNKHTFKYQTLLQLLQFTIITCRPLHWSFTQTNCSPLKTASCTY